MRSLLAVLLTAALPVLAAPPAPAGAEDGDIVEVEGELYEVWDGELVPLDVEGLAPAEGEGEGEGEGELDEDTPVLDLRVTGSRLQGKRSAVRTDTIDQQLIDETGSRTLSDALQRVGGIQVSSPTGTGDNVQIDGLGGKYIKILIDGRPVNGTVNGAVDVGRLPVSLADVERIEIVRGPMSALYGSDAMGGVVNIITTRPSSRFEGDFDLTTRVDGQGLQRSSFGARLNGGTELFAVKLTLSALQDRAVDRATRAGDEIVLRPDGVFDLPHKRQLISTLEASLYPTDDWALRVYGNAQSSEIENRLAAGLPLRDHTADNQFQMGVVAEGDLAPLHTLKIDTRIDRFIHRFEKLPDAGQRGTPPFCESTPFDVRCPAPARLLSLATQDQSRTEVIYSGVLLEKAPFAEELKLAAGGVLRFDELTRLNGDLEDSLPGGGQRALTAAYFELGWRPVDALTIAPGARFESIFDVEDGGVTTIPALSPRISARYDLPLGFALTSSYGNAFRVPDFLERFLRFDHSDLGYIVEGNPDLQPESSHGFRAEALYDGGYGVSLGVEGYLTLTNDLIEPRPTDRFGGDGIGGEVPIFSYVNLSRAYLSGVNVRANIADLYGFGFDLSYQYVIQAVDASRCPDDNPWFCSGDDGALSLPNRPFQTAHVGARYKVAATDTTLFTQADLQEPYLALVGVVGSSGLGNEGGAYRQVNGWVNWRAGVRQPVGDKAEVLIVLDNLLDAYDPVFAPKPGRTALLTLKAGF